MRWFLREALRWLLFGWLCAVHAMAAVLVAMGLYDWETVQPIYWAAQADGDAMLRGLLVMAGPTAVLYFILWGWREMFTFRPRGNREPEP